MQCGTAFPGMPIFGEASFFGRWPHFFGYADFLPFPSETKKTFSRKGKRVI
jgi:hypothetical protein